jgi:hypothetical protein
MDEKVSCWFFFLFECEYYIFIEHMNIHYVGLLKKTECSNSLFATPEVELYLGVAEFVATKTLCKSLDSLGQPKLPK